MKAGDWVTVKPHADTPAMFRPDGKPTKGRIQEIYLGDSSAWADVWVPIGDADVDAHSQSVPYNPADLEIAEAPA